MTVHHAYLIDHGRKAYVPPSVRVQGVLRGTPPASRRPTRDTGNGPARRVRVAAFPGTGFIAEREGDELVVYLVSGDAVSTETINDGMTAARMQKINEASRAR